MKLEPPVEKSGKIGDYLQVGQNIMVQIAKEAISTKGPRLTADISLAGRNVVLVPFSSKVFLSQKIRSVDEKKRLKADRRRRAAQEFRRHHPYRGHGGQGRGYRARHPDPDRPLAQDLCGDQEEHGLPPS